MYIWIGRQERERERERETEKERDRDRDRKRETEMTETDRAGEGRRWTDRLTDRLLTRPGLNI